MTATATAIKLTAGQIIRMTGGSDFKRITVGTCEGFARRYNQDPAASYADSRAKGEETAWTSLEASVLSSDGTSEQRLAAIAVIKEQIAAAPLIENGSTVEIEGRAYLVHYNGPGYADPIRFIEAA